MNETANQERRFYTTSSGLQIPVKPIHVRTLDDLELLLQKARDIHPPTYTVTLAGGDEQDFPHDETTLQTDEEREAWASYLSERREAIEHYNQTCTRTFITFGVNGDPPEDGWVDEFEFCGIEVPISPAERKVFYFERVALTDPVDRELFVQKLYLISALSGEALERADALFRHMVERQHGGVDTASGSAGTKREMEA